MCIVDINGEDLITAQGVFDELSFHQTAHVKSKINISLCKKKSYQRTDLEYICYIFDQLRPVISHPGVRLPKKPPTPKYIGEGLKGSQRQLWKESLFVKYDMNKNVRLLPAPISIKSPPEEKTVLRSLIAPIIKEGDCSYVCKFVPRHCANGGSCIKGIGFDQSYSPVPHAESFRINIDNHGYA